MSKNSVVKLTGRDTITDPLTELLRTSAEPPCVRIVVVFIFKEKQSNRGRQESEKCRGTVRSSKSKWYER